MTREEYVFRISSLTQELTGLAAEYFSTQRDPYEVAGERFNQAVDAFEQDSKPERQRQTPQLTLRSVSRRGRGFA